MIEHLVDLAKLVVGVTVGSVIGSYVMEWRIRRLVKRELPKIMEETGKRMKVKMSPKQEQQLKEAVKYSLTLQRREGVIDEETYHKKMKEYDLE